MNKAREELCKISAKLASRLRDEGTLWIWASNGKFSRDEVRDICIDWLNRKYFLGSGPKKVEVCMQYVERAYRIELLKLIEGSKI